MSALPCYVDSKGEGEAMKLSYILIIWFSSYANYAYIPVKVDTFSSIEACQRAGKSFIEQADLRGPTFACLPRG